MGRWEVALAASGEAIDIHRELAAARSQRARPDLAWSLDNLAAGRVGLGRTASWRAPDEKAFTIGPEQVAHRYETELSIRVVHVHPRFHPSPAWLEDSEDRSDTSRGGLSK